MTALALGLGAAWAALVLVAARRRRPPPARLRLLTKPRTRPRPARDPLAAVGALVLRAARRPVVSARPVGATTLATAATLVVAPPLTPAVLLAGWAVPRQRARTATRRRRCVLEDSVPDTVDLLMLAVGAGCNVHLAVAATGRRGTGPLAAELRRVTAEVARGRRLADALDDLPARAGEPARRLAGVLAGCERYGTPVLPALERLADEVRLARQRRAETAARRVPVALLFPLVLCILPAFALLTVAPLVAGALRELRL